MIKILILDVDGTLYPLEKVMKQNFQNGAFFLAKRKKISAEEAEKELLDYGIKPYADSQNKSITAYILSQGIQLEEWNEYRNNKYTLAQVNKGECVNPECIHLLSDKYHIAVLSSNSYVNVKKTLEYIGISEHWFYKVVCLDNNCRNIGIFDKHLEMSVLVKESNAEFSEMLSIGDRYKTDIEPALSLGGNGILVSSPKALEEVAEKLISGKMLLSNDRYTIYNSKMNTRRLL